MSYWQELQALFTQNMGIAPEHYVLIVTILSSLVVAAKSHIMAILYLFLMTAIWFLIYYSIGWNMFYVTLLLFFNIVVLAITLFSLHSEGRLFGGGVA